MIPLATFLTHFKVFSWDSLARINKLVTPQHAKFLYETYRNKMQI